MGLDRREAAQGLTRQALHQGILNTELFYCCHSEALNTLAQPFAWFNYESGGILTLEQSVATSIYLATNDA